MHVRDFAKRHPVLVYYLLTFALSWGAVLAEVGPGGFPHSPAQLSKKIPVLLVSMLLGPVIASILLTGVIEGSTGYRDLLSRLLQWRVRIEWWGLAILMAPLLLMAVPLALSIGNPQFLPHIFTDPNKRSLLQLGLAAGLSAGFFEELGWTGFVIPRLRRRFGVVSTGAIVGFLWGAWHIPIIALQTGIPSDAISIANFSGAFIGLLPVFRVIMVWVYDRSRSLFLAIIMHTSLTTSTIIFALDSAKGMTSPFFNLAISGVLWIVIALVSAASRGATVLHSTHG